MGQSFVEIVEREMEGFSRERKKREMAILLMRE